MVEEKEGTQTTIELIDVMKECSKNKDSLIGNGLTIEESVTYENIKDTLKLVIIKHFLFTFSFGKY